MQKQLMTLAPFADPEAHELSTLTVMPSAANQHAPWASVQMVPMLYDWSKITNASDQLVLEPSM